MNAPVRVKICGITNAEDAAMAINAGADALGFNLYAGSKRCLSLDAESDWIAELPHTVTKVAVLVNAPFEEALRVSASPGIDLVQLHGDEDADYCRRLAEAGRPFIKAMRIRTVEDLASASSFATSDVLLDAQVDGAFGGTGVRLEMALVAEFVRQNPQLHIWLAGGLTPENVGAAVRAARPYAVDVASGVESNPRRKDPAKVRAFVAAARAGV